MIRLSLSAITAALLIAAPAFAQSTPAPAPQTPVVVLPAQPAKAMPAPAAGTAKPASGHGCAMKRSYTS